MPYFVVTVERGAARFILADGPLGGEDRAPRIMHVVDAPNEDAVRSLLATDPWANGMLAVVKVEPWTILLGGFDAAR